MQMYRRVMTAVVATAMVLAAAPAFAQGATQNSVSASEPWVESAGPPSGRKTTSLSTSTPGPVAAGIWFGGNRDGRVGLMGELSYAVKKVSDEFDEEVERSYVRFPCCCGFNAGHAQRTSPASTSLPDRCSTSRSAPSRVDGRKSTAR
jgi:hypothetical protein